MQNPRLASRYAKSVLDLAVEQNILEPTLKDMQLLHDICEMSAEFKVMLRSPVINSDKKNSAIQAVLERHNVGKLTFTFITLLVNKGREKYLPEIAESFIDQYKVLSHISTVYLTTAVPISLGVKEAIMAKVAGYMTGETIDLKTAVNAELIGGFVLEVGDKLYDASVKKSLDEVRTRVIDHSYETKI